MMYAYFPGCSAHSTGISYTNSYSYVALAAGIELAEIPNWNCCGSISCACRKRPIGRCASRTFARIFRKKRSAMLPY